MVPLIVGPIGRAEEPDLRPTVRRRVALGRIGQLGVHGVVIETLFDGDDEDAQP
jgi:hypothetical protein